MTGEEIERMKRNIEIQLDEYQAALEQYAQWILDWKKRRPKGFRIRKAAP